MYQNFSFIEGSVSKLNQPIQSSVVGAGFACPKTQSKLFSGERTSPLRTKRQHYPRFDTLLAYESFETPSLLCWHVFMESLFSDAALPFRSKCLSDKLPKPMRLHLSLFQKLPWRILWNKALAGFLCKLLPI